MAGSAVASCGTMSSCALMSYSFWHMLANTVRPSKVEAVVGSRASGAPARPTVMLPDPAAAAERLLLLLPPLLLLVVAGAVQAASTAASAAAATDATK